MLFSGTSGKTIKDSGAQISALQPKDATLTALAGLAATNGLIEQTGTDVFAIRGIGVSPTTSVPTTALADARYAPISVTGNVTGPGSAVSANIATFNGTTGKIIQDGGTAIASLATAASVPVPATVAPVMDGTATVGVATKYAREDHMHPTDTSIPAPATVAPIIDGTAAVGVAAQVCA